MVYVPLQLLPRYPQVPLRATIRVHQPVPLSQIILQPIFQENYTSNIHELDVRYLGSGSAWVETAGTDQPNGHRTNGHMNGDEHNLGASHRILREGHNILIPTTSDSHHVPFRILMLEPVGQGYFTPDTKVILSTIPYDPDPDEENDNAEGSVYGHSSHGKTHMSMADFDPDTFLSSSLSLALHSSSADGDGDMDQSVSSTSGSITPRPPGTVFRPSSPPARPLDMEDMDDQDADAGGMKFAAVVAQGPADAQDDVCWVSVGGLGRAGIFEGDWVSFAPISKTITDS